jgi:HK97 family phage portal protein
MDGYQKNPYVYAGVRLIASGVAGIPWLLEKNDEEIESHPALDLMARPNPYMAGPQFKELVVTYLELAGEVFIRRIDVGGRAAELQVLPPGNVEIKSDDKTGTVTGYTLKGPGGVTVAVYKPAEVLNLKFHNPLDPKRGMSPLNPAARAIDQSNESKDWNISLLKNKANPSGVVTIEGHLDDAEFTRLKQEVAEKFSGKENAGKPLLLEGGMKFDQTTLSPDEMSWLEGQKLSAREIAIALGIQPELLGDSANKTYSNYGEARKAFYEETILPLCRWIAGEFSRWLLEPGLVFELDTDNVPALQEDRSGVFARLQTADYLTINEKRESVGYAAVPEGDVILMPLSLMPLGESYQPSAPLVPAKEPAEAEAGESQEAEDGQMGAESKGCKPDDDEENRKATHWKTVDARRRGYDRRVARACEERLKSDIKAAAQAFGAAATVEAGKVAIDNIFQTDLTDEWDWTLRSIYQVVGKDFAEQSYSKFKSCRPSEIKADVQDVWMDGLMNYLNRTKGIKIAGITKTTKQAILKELAEGADAGEGIPQLAKRVDAFRLSPIIAHRSETIARTEVIAASNAGALEGARSTGLPMKKEWVATRDDRTRDDHLDADGQAVGLDDMFNVGGSAMEFPGDLMGGAPAEQTINCRCTHAFIVKE